LEARTGARPVGAAGKAASSLPAPGKLVITAEAVASGPSMRIRLILKGLSSDGGIGTGEARCLIFSGEQNPDYQDFASFSFVIGMSCQVSDVNVSSRSMHRLILLRGLLSFGFNTVILALSINIISDLLVN
jgi:Protein of unknown function (DUF1345)